MKPFANPKAQVGPLSSELVEKLEQCVKPDTILSNLSANINEWTAGKRGMFTLNFWQEDSIASLQADVARGDGWAAADVSRAARTLLLAYDKRGLAHCEEAFASPEELLAHKEGCAFRPVECQNHGCVQVVGANSAGAHDASCPHKLLKCPQGCGRTSNAALREHSDQCDMKPALPYRLGSQRTVGPGSACRDAPGRTSARGGWVAGSHRRSRRRRGSGTSSCSSKASCRRWRRPLPRLPLQVGPGKLAGRCELTSLNGWRRRRPR